MCTSVEAQDASLNLLTVANEQGGLEDDGAAIGRAGVASSCTATAATIAEQATAAAVSTSSGASAGCSTVAGNDCV